MHVRTYLLQHNPRTHDCSQVLSIYDLDHQEALQANIRMRMNAIGGLEDSENHRKAISVVGGRLSYLGKVSKAKNMLEQAEHMLAVEKAWLQSQIGLIEDCDDDVMDEVNRELPLCSTSFLTQFVNTISKNGVRVLGCCCESL